MFLLVILLNLNENDSLSNEENVTESLSVTEVSETTIQSDDSTKPDNTATTATVTGADATVTGANATVTGANATVTGANATVTAANATVTTAAGRDDDDDDADDDDDDDDVVKPKTLQTLVKPKKISKLGESEDTIPPKYRSIKKSDYNKIKNKKK
ncbi:unnamed protein product [Schistosoma margrebowiei]|uniref:Uncharacterized protein n=1 Tax=Schistosoma margrebowiei TaxID=48269 RepID=A0AA85AJD9_9TREM|nr:unnamed protein product [Schistosoma margrebowiei]